MKARQGFSVLNQMLGTSKEVFVLHSALGCEPAKYMAVCMSRHENSGSSCILNVLAPPAPLFVQAFFRAKNLTSTGMSYRMEEGSTYVIPAMYLRKMLQF